MLRHEQPASATIDFMHLRIAANTISQLLGKVIGAGTTFLISLFLAREFGVIGYGDFVKVTTYVSFFFLLADFGLNAVYLQRQKDPTSFPTLIGARIIGGTILIFLALAILAFLPQGESQGYTSIVRLGIILFSPAILFQGLITTTNAVFQKHLRYDVSTISLAAGSIVSLILLLLFFKTSANAAVVGSITLLAGAIATALTAFIGVKILKEPISISLSPAKVSGLFMASLPLGLTLLFTLVYGHIDSVILTLTRPTEDVGIYGLAYKVFEIILVFPTFFMNALYPLMLKASQDELVGVIKKSGIFLFAVAVVGVITTWIAAPYLTLIQEGFVQSVAPLRILSLSLPFFFLSALCMWALITLKKQILLAIIYGGVMILNIFLNTWLIPQYGYIAAAWTTVVCEGVVLTISGFLLLRYISK
jgi:O-antigen/teichoic acid export membrane protein